MAKENRRKMRNNNSHNNQEPTVGKVLGMFVEYLNECLQEYDQLLGKLQTDCIFYLQILIK